MKLKKLAALAGAAALTVTALPVLPVYAEDAEEIVFAFHLTKTVDMQPIEDALNEITIPEIGVKVDLEGIQMANYANQVGMMMSGGEQVDVIAMLGDYADMLSKNQLLCLDDYIDEYGAGIKEVLGEEFLKATSKNGSLYALPNNNGKAAVLNIVLRDDLIQELELPVDQLTLASDFDGYCANLDLLSDMFAKIHEAHPEYACLVPSGGNSLLFDGTVPFMDMLNDNYGILSDDGSTVVNLYETEEYKKLISYAHEWNQAGYVLEDATTTQEAANTYLQNGRAAAFFIKGEEGQAEQIITATGIPVQSIKLLQPYICTTDVNGIDFGISATSKHPEAAMKFLNLMYTNADVVNLLDWGIEGVHYEVQDDGTVDFPEGLDANTTAYGLNQDWYFGNQFLSYIWGKGRDTTIYERLESNNKNSEFSPVMGFSYDSTVVATELAAIVNVRNQYVPGLECGSLDPETDLEAFNKALYDAGLQTVIDEKQAQLDAWKEANQ